jgi:NADH-quinone oxidoreductase subunit F
MRFSTNASDVMEKPLTQHIQPDRKPLDIADYEKVGGYQALRKALGMSPSDVQKTVKDSNLRGRGGAGFVTGQKWSFVPMGPDARKPKYLTVNADEMEPGTFKDRLLLEGNPNLIVEAAIISSYALEVDVAYIFLRWAYKTAARNIEKAIAQAYEKRYLGKNTLGSGYDLEMHLHVSSGRYMCGEEDGLLDALEGRRATPRIKPPYPQTCGLWGKPTVVNNVETLANVPFIVERGPQAFKDLSLTEEGGTKLYGASGRVNNPGLWELPMGTPLGEIFNEHAGGMVEGYKFRGLLPGGASTDFLTAEHFDVKMDFASVQKAGSRLGTGTMIVLDDQKCPVGMVHNLLKFFARESCGWCTPCREGLPWIAETLEAIENGQGRPQDLDLLEEHTKLLSMGHTFCALAPGAMEPLQSALRIFREDFEKHISEHRCPWKG